MLRSGWHRCVQRVGSVILNPPKSSGKMTGLASRAAHANDRAIFLHSGWTLVPDSSEAPCDCADASKVLRLHLMAKAWASGDAFRRPFPGF